MQQSVSLLRVRDPLFKRVGASRLTRFAIDGKFSYQCLCVTNCLLSVLYEPYFFGT